MKCYANFKKLIWNKRCDEVIEIEKSKGIQKKDKQRKRIKLNNTEDMDDDQLVINMERYE